MRKIVSLVCILASLVILASTFACCSGVGVLKAQERLRVASSSRLYDTGLWALLEPKFEDKYDVELDVLYANTGIAIEYGKRGDVDVIAVHDKARELTFIEEGYGTTRNVFAYNYFVIAGPESDPLGLKEMSPEEAFKKLANSKTAKFVSRGDDSGTHSKEKAIWKAAGFVYDDIKKSGDWYVEAGRGMGPTLVMAGELQAYTLSDIGTFLAYKSDTKLVPIVEKGSIMLNVYSVIPVNPQKITTVKNELAQKLADFMVSEEVQKMIGDYGVKDYGRSLFTPCAGNEPSS